MDQEISRIKLNKLYAEDDIFKEIIFYDGINIILGEKYDNTNSAGRKTNGVGKSMCVEFIDFCLLGKYSDSRVSKIPEEILPVDKYIMLDLEIGDNCLTIKRNRKSPESVVIIRNDKKCEFDDLNSARNYLTEMIFKNMNGQMIPSFRSLLSLLVRDERSEFVDILKCHEATKRIPIDFTPHLYFFRISIELYKEMIKTIKEIEIISKVISREKRELTENGKKKMDEVKAQFNSMSDELNKLEQAIDNFKSNEAFNSLEKELIQLETQLDELREEQKIVRYEYNKIKTLPKPERIDDKEVELVYNHFKTDLGSAIVKNFNDVLAFKNKVEEFQNVLINQKAKELENKLDEITKKIRLYDDEYAEKVKIIDKKGVLKNLKSSLKIYEDKKESFSHLKFLFQQYDKNDKTKKLLSLERTKETLEMDGVLEQIDHIIASFTDSLLGIHESIMGNQECSFEIKTVENPKRKDPIEINMRIFDDGSHSVNRTKVFIYDVALMFNKYTRIRHPLFLIHDNIFDVDQDTLVQCLNYLQTQEEKYRDFQYILTLNRDKIENEEKRQLVNLDIDAHTVAIFTKKNKFLNVDYQEK